jgi:hypothetical protein
MQIESGVFQSVVALTAEQFYIDEKNYRLDLNGDQVIGPAFVDSVVQKGEIEFGTYLAGHAFRLSNSSDLVHERTADGIIASSSLPGLVWVGLGVVRLSLSRLALFWKNAINKQEDWIWM